jgi:hypothetical protein
MLRGVVGDEFASLPAKVGAGGEFATLHPHLEESIGALAGHQIETDAEGASRPARVDVEDGIVAVDEVRFVLRFETALGDTAAGDGEGRSGLFTHRESLADRFLLAGTVMTSVADADRSDRNALEGLEIDAVFGSRPRFRLGSPGGVVVSLRGECAMLHRPCARRPR